MSEKRASTRHKVEYDDMNYRLLRALQEYQLDLSYLKDAGGFSARSSAGRFRGQGQPITDGYGDPATAIREALRRWGKPLPASQQQPRDDAGTQAHWKQVSEDGDAAMRAVSEKKMDLIHDSDGWRSHVVQSTVQQTVMAQTSPIEAALNGLCLLEKHEQAIAGTEEGSEAID
jgi:hypothetical protein